MAFGARKLHFLSKLKQTPILQDRNSISLPSEEDTRCIQGILNLIKALNKRVQYGRKILTGPVSD